MKKREQRKIDVLKNRAFNFGYLIISNHITKEGRKVGWLYRERPTDDMDSGWRLFSGYEDSSFLDDPNNFAIYSLESTLNVVDAVVGEILATGRVGSSFERDEAGNLNRVYE